MLSYDREDDQYSPFRCGADRRNLPAPSQSFERVYKRGQGSFDLLDFP